MTSGTCRCTNRTSAQTYKTGTPPTLRCSLCGKLIGSDTDVLIHRFVTESNLIEGIDREPTPDELQATETFLETSLITVASLEEFVAVCQPGAKLRTRRGMDVRVGHHCPPPGGPDIRTALEKILQRVDDDFDPFDIHVAYETLHPFMDGNGRSGRVLWAWQMVDEHGMDGLKLGFLHRWYYQSLSRRRNET